MGVPQWSILAFQPWNVSLGGAEYMLVAVLTTAASWHSEQPLLTYRVPPALEPLLRIGQLVAVPYGPRLVEGITWFICHDIDGFSGDDAHGAVSDLPHYPLDSSADQLNQPLEGEWEESAQDQQFELRDLHEILDLEPVLLPHQMALAQWMAIYYVAPLAQVAQMMLPPGLVQRSRYVLRLNEGDRAELSNAVQTASLPLRSLVGLLLTEGEIDVEKLKSMLGPTKARQLLKEVRANSLIEYASQLQQPRVKPQMRRVVRLLLQGEALLEWRERKLSHIEQGLAATRLELDPVVATSRTAQLRRQKHDPWALMNAAAALTLASSPPADPETLLAQRQLAAIDLLLQSSANATPWSVAKLCKASGLSEKQLQQLAQEQVVAIEKVEIRRNPLMGRTISTSDPLQLTADQRHALDCIIGPQAERTRPIVLHGVTGSGKTEVYLQALTAMIAQGKRGILLVPEIALTTQAIQRVAARFPNRIAIIHSDLSIGERYDEWRRIRAGQVDVVIGSRSALFAPVPDLGIIILDEEHEPAYKQSDFKPTYHARSAAIQLGRMLQIPVVLGSATPAVETYYRATQGEYRLVELPGRIGAKLPPVEVVDLRAELHAGNTSIISRRLQQELERVLNCGQQAILFLNRRGAASCVLCRDCGFVALCDRCDIPLTYHATERVLLCHYCGRRNKILQFCPQCRSSSMRYFGLGTEKVQATIQQCFPDARLLRWDRDTARNRRAHEELLDRFASREADILIGTQMIAKGLDLPGVTLVGVISADIALGLPDYATPERTFTLLTQVAGRAGRGSEPGHVIVQTFNPLHFCIDTASRHDYHEFYAVEIEARRQFGYPPFRQFAKFTYKHENRHRCRNEALLLYERLLSWIDRLGMQHTDIVGPAPAAIEKIRGKYHWQLIVRGPDLHPLLRVIEAPGWAIDIDPVSTL
jgi:primosomal protein N' (replication factor Y)